MTGGGAALLGWAVAEWLGVRNGVVSGLFGEALTCGLIAGAIGAGMNIVSDRAGANRVELGRRALAGLLTGGIAAVIGASIGHALLGALHGGRAVGWALAGAGIGAAEGLYERSPTVLRRGVITGAVGGLVGGLPFGEVYSILSQFWEAGSRATAFVLYGTCVGASIGLAEASFARVGPTAVEGRHRRRRPTPCEQPGGHVLSAGLAPQAKPTSVTPPARPKAATTNTAQRQPTVMTPCPKCNRPVPGTRPYCVFCKLSF